MMENHRYYVERCLDGHPDDFRHLVRRYQQVLLAPLAGKLGSRDRAEDSSYSLLEGIAGLTVSATLRDATRRSAVA